MRSTVKTYKVSLAYLLCRYGTEVLIQIKEAKDMKRDIDDKKKTRFVRYKEGAALYSMCQTKFERLAKDANAIYKVDKLVLVNTDILDDYLETFHIITNYS